MTAPPTAPPSAWGSGKSFANILSSKSTLTPEEQAAEAKRQQERKHAEQLANQARIEQALATKVVTWATEWIKTNGDKLPNGGPTFSESPVSMVVWGIVTTKWEQKSDQSFNFRVRGPTRKGKSHVHAGESVGNLERFVRKTGYRGVDLHVLVNF
jgi:hypothetical protein